METTVQEPQAINPVADAMKKFTSSLGSLTPKPAQNENKPTEQKAEPEQKEAVQPLETPNKSHAETTPNISPSDDDESKWPRSAQDWKKYRAAAKEREQKATQERDEAKKQLEAVRAEIEKVKTAGASPELDSLKKERDELSERLRVADVVNHPRFKSYFNGKIDAQITLAKQIAPEYADKLSSLLKEPASNLRDQQIEDISAALSPLKQSQLAGIVNNMAAIEMERQGEIANAAKSYDALQKTETENRTKSQQQLVQQRETAFNAEFKAISDPDKGLFIFKKENGNDAHNNAVEERVKMAKNLLTGNNPADLLARASLYAVAFPELQKHSLAQADEIKKLQAQVKALSVANPAGGSSAANGSSTNATAEEVKVGMSPQQAIGAWFKNVDAIRKGAQ